MLRNEGGETLDQLPGEVEDALSLAGWGSGQPDLVEDVPAHKRDELMDQLNFEGAFQPTAFCDSMNL